MLKEINDKDFTTSTEKGLVVVDFGLRGAGHVNKSRQYLQNSRRKCPMLLSSK
jgi:hypothetical protein